MPNTLVEASLPLSSQSDTLETDILDLINAEAVIGMDALVAFLPQHSWCQIFHAIDRLARSGKIVLRRHRFDYTLFSKHYAE